MIRDLRFGLRMLLKQPGFTSIAILTLALGIGATAAVFSLVEGVLLTPPPYQQPERLVLVPSARSDGQPGLNQGLWPAAQWTDWQKEAASFESLAAYSWSFDFLVGDEGSESLEGMIVTRDYFRVVHLQPILGRAFVESDAGVAPPPTIILGYDFWQRKFNGDPRIIGKTVRIEPIGYAADCDRRHAAGRAFPAVAWRRQGAELRPRCPVDFWVPVIPDPARRKRPSWNVDRPPQGRCDASAGRSGVDSPRGPRSEGRARLRGPRAQGDVADRRTEPRRAAAFCFRCSARQRSCC